MRSLKRILKCDKKVVILKYWNGDDIKKKVFIEAWCFLVYFSYPPPFPPQTRSKPTRSAMSGSKYLNIGVAYEDHRLCLLNGRENLFLVGFLFDHSTTEVALLHQLSANPFHIPNQTVDAKFYTRSYHVEWIRMTWTKEEVGHYEAPLEFTSSRHTISSWQALALPLPS